MSTKRFEEEYVLAALDARLVPPNPSVPDCQCTVMLTEEHLYILEDNFDGTFEKHFAIPIRDVLAIESVTYKDDQGEKTPEQRARDRAAVNLGGAFLGLLGGLLVMRAQSSRWNTHTQYLCLTYRDAAGKEEHLYCKECAGSIKRLAGTLRKLKEQRVLE